jgi:anti-sigma B factor antagonist
LEGGFLKFLLNLHRGQYIDSRGLGGIVRAHTIVTRKGGKLKMFNVVQRIRNLSDVTKLTPVLEGFDSEEAALRSFEGTVSTLA